jgi:plasmid stabilization system protein ParE
VPFVFAGIIPLENRAEANFDQIARHTFQSKASIMRRYVQEGVAKDKSGRFLKVD